MEHINKKKYASIGLVCCLIFGPGLSLVHAEGVKIDQMHEGLLDNYNQEIIQSDFIMGKIGSIEEGDPIVIILDMFGFKAEDGKDLEGNVISGLAEFIKYYNFENAYNNGSTIEQIFEEVISSSLKLGDVGAEVIALKEYLYLLGIISSEDINDEFDLTTEEVIVDFQSKHNLRENGIVDSITFNKIESLLREKKDSENESYSESGEGNLLSDNKDIDSILYKDNNKIETDFEYEKKLDKVDEVENSIEPHSITVDKEVNTETTIIKTEEVDSTEAITSFSMTSTNDAQSNDGLRNGDREPLVIDLKINLSTLGFHVSDNPNENYGPSTERVVKEFQAYYGLEVSGVAGELTFAKIDEILSSPLSNGRNHTDTITLKENLSRLGFHVSDNPNTAYGPSTERRVREFQSFYGLRENGIGDEVTLAKIEELIRTPMGNGDYRQDAVLLKENMAKLGFVVSATPTPQYGPSTERTVRELQSYYGLSVTGSVGEETWSKIEEVLNSPLQNGQNHADTIPLKEKLSMLGFHVSDNPNTAYGPSTERQVRAFQHYYGLRENGIADHPTLDRIDEILSSPLQNGRNHSDVITLKENLSRLGFHVSDNPNTAYGPSTESRVRDFQAFYGLRENGIGDEVTLAKMNDLIQTPMRIGDYRQDVVLLKENMAKLGFVVSANPTPQYGPTTERTVRELQAYYGLSVTGGVDQEAWSKIEDILNSPLQNGRSHPDTITLKENLSRLGFHVSDNPNTSFGPATERQVRAFQREHGLIVNGMADDVTLSKIDELLSVGDSYTYTIYELSLEEAVSEQQKLNPPPQTDLYRGLSGFIHSSDLQLFGSITGSSVNLRRAPSTSGAIATNVSRGTEFVYVREVIGDSVSGSEVWYEISYDNRQLYVHSSLANRYGFPVVSINKPAKVYQSANRSSYIFNNFNNPAYLTMRLPIHAEVKGETVSGNDFWYDVRPVWRNAKVEDFIKYLNPNKNDPLQHVVLDKSTGIPSSQLNNVLRGQGIFDSKGQAFINAGQTNGVNEVYLIAHALLESGNGSSQLSNGIEVGKDHNGNLVLVNLNNRNSLTEIKTTYNMFGIGAQDQDPYTLGAIKAYEEGWFTPEQAIIGGAAFISNSYFERGQNTLYKMRWNHLYLNSWGGYSQYATDMGWSVKQIPRMKSLYEQMENPRMEFDIVQYK
ncbi:peptidoglycan-binding protein [Alteribacter keqinensis]|uniref:Beta-N-acetylglucosaminidase n=1 Tax=Alteribacter keqinensis TaxID=2483800 RepID=A0A3M7TPM8_9BACI|nr:peptidoglycan-binding protein [Alteribacter keqinensis]RNA67584.1 hypothetical protein EBO34_12725 [Alteribacter keqinensis]